MRFILLSGLLICLFAFPLFAQQSEPISDRLNERLKSDELRVGVLLQSIGVYSFEDDNFNGGRKFDLGATRVDVRGMVDGNYTYRLQVDLRRSSPVIDAQVGYHLSDEFRFVAGAFKPSLSADLDPSPADTDFINRARQVGAMMNSREIGVTALGDFESGLNYRFGIYNGTGLSRQNDNKFLYTARVGYSTDLDPGSLELGFQGAVNQTQLEQVGNTGLTSQGDRTLFGGFFKFDLGQIFGTVEYLQTQFDLATDQGVEETISGFYGTLGNRISQNNELLIRWDRLDFDVTDSASDLFSLGWNHQATSLISFQVNALFRIDDDDTMDDQFGISGNFQFSF